MKDLLDTKVVCERLAARPMAGVLAGIAAHPAESAISAIAWQEMPLGLERLPASARCDRVRAYLRERVRLSGIGRTPLDADAQIAAIVAVNGLVPVTRTAGDCSAFVGLDVENWFRPLDRGQAVTPDSRRGRDIRPRLPVGVQRLVRGALPSVRRPWQAPPARSMSPHRTLPRRDLGSIQASPADPPGCSRHRLGTAR